ncbi:MAG: PDR/VanB family oxidoreductase [Geminicoccales bacterium]
MSARIIMKLEVVGRERLTDEISRLTFAHPNRPELPAWQPGAHVDLRLPDSKVRQYSLTSDPADLSHYGITVKREADGRGGSAWVHDNLHQGSIAHVSEPRNNFPLADGPGVFIAGGIGVTPMLAMARALAARGDLRAFHLCEKARPSAFEDDLSRSPAGAFTMHVSADGPDARLNVEALIAGLPQDVHIYCCGPRRLIEAVEAATVDWPEEQVHFEVFTPMVDENFNPEPFDVTVASSGQTYRVPADQSALDVLREAGHVLPSSCELGVCGSCECEYTDGTVIHRDSVLRHNARQNRMMLCVSRARVAVTVNI